MKYPIYIEKDEDSDYGVTVPDLPGCFSAGSTVEEAIANAEEAILTHSRLSPSCPHCYGKDFEVGGLSIYEEKSLYDRREATLRIRDRYAQSCS